MKNTNVSIVIVGEDSQHRDREGLAAIRNLFNEWYLRDTAKKARIPY